MLQRERTKLPQQSPGKSKPVKLQPLNSDSSRLTSRTMTHTGESVRMEFINGTKLQHHVTSICIESRFPGEKIDGTVRLPWLSTSKFTPDGIRIESSLSCDVSAKWRCRSAMGNKRIMLPVEPGTVHARDCATIVAVAEARGSS